MKSPRWRVFLLADRGLEADRFLGDLEDLVDLVDRDLHLLGDLFGRGSRESSCWRCRWVRISLLIVSIMCTGMRIVRAWSAIARVIAWRIHHVAYVENL
jgi:hypothetical protein